MTEWKKPLVTLLSALVIFSFFHYLIFPIPSNLVIYSIEKKIVYHFGAASVMFFATLFVALIPALVYNFLTKKQKLSYSELFSKVLIFVIVINGLLFFGAAYPSLRRRGRPY